MGNTARNNAAGKHSGARRHRRALLVVVAASTLLNVWAIGWGLPNRPGSWAADEFSPGRIHDAIAKRFSNGWFELYPPMHAYVLALAQAPIEGLARAGLVSFESPRVYEAAYYVLRLVSVVMAAGIVLVVAALARTLFSARAAVWSAATAACVAPLVYYGKVANVDVPFVFWLLWSLLWLLRILETGRFRHYAAFTVTAAFAIGTKDQAYGFYLFVPLVVGLAELAARRRAGIVRPFLSAFINRRMIGAGVLGLVLLAVIHNLAFNAPAAMERVRIITGDMTTNMQAFPNTPSGHVGLIAAGVRHVRFSLGWPLFAVCAVGTGVAIARWRRDPRPLALLVPIVSYWVFLIMPIRYTFDRYLMPVAFILAVFAGPALTQLADFHGRWRIVRMSLVVAIFGYSIAYASSVNALMSSDSRYETERWMRANIPADSRLLAVGVSMYLPRFDGLAAVLSRRPTIEELDLRAPDYVVTTSLYDESRFPRDAAASAFFMRLKAGTTGYTVVHQSRKRPRWNLLSLADVRSNLEKISPDVTVYRRK